MVKRLSLKNMKTVERLADKDKKLQAVLVELPILKGDFLNPYNEKNLNRRSLEKLEKIVNLLTSLLEEKGVLFIYGAPVHLMKLYPALQNKLKFRYWIALDLMNRIEKETAEHLKHNHAGILMLTKGEGYLKLKTKEVRVPYRACTYCGRNVKDWGGKKHLMNKKGKGVSDVWNDFYKIIDTKENPSVPDITLNVIESSKAEFSYKTKYLPKPARKRLLNLLGSNRKILNVRVNSSLIERFNKIKVKESSKPVKVSDEKIRNKVLLGDAIELMESWVKDFPEGVFDLTFADPPYNLDKSYGTYDDEKADEDYIAWCDRWIELMAKLTKPTGSIFVLNIPKWSLEHAKVLNKHAYFQNWIVWDALSVPKGKIMPAHYSLLYYTKSPDNYTYNDDMRVDSLEYCLRSSCRRERRKITETNMEVKSETKPDNKLPLSDIWSDVHRIKHKKDRDNHPCQLPDKLMDRIVNLFSEEGDLVFDPFAGAGTTALSAVRNNRDYCTVELDPKYKKITEKKIQELKTEGKIERKSTVKRNKSIYTKKDLELKAQGLAEELDRKPTLEEFVEHYSLDLQQIEVLYDGEPKRALKAGRIRLLNNS